MGNLNNDQQVVLDYLIMTEKNFNFDTFEVLRYIENEELGYIDDRELTAKANRHYFVMDYRERLEVVRKYLEFLDEE